MNNESTIINAIGIDPGISGAMSVITINVSSVVDVNSFRFKDIISNKVDIKPFFQNKDNLVIAIENVHSMPQDSKKSLFTFGAARGWWDGYIFSHGVDPNRIYNPSPSEGHSIFLDFYFTPNQRRENKQKTVEYVNRTFKGLSPIIPLPVDKPSSFDIADSLCLALYATWKRAS